MKKLNNKTLKSSSINKIKLLKFIGLTGITSMTGIFGLTNVNATPNLTLGEINNNKDTIKTNVEINLSEVTVSYPSNLNTDVQKFLIPATGKIIIDFYGVNKSNNNINNTKEILTNDSIIEKYQLISDDTRTRLILSVRQEILNYLKNNNNLKYLSIEDIIISQSPTQTKIAFKADLLAAVHFMKKNEVKTLLTEKIVQYEKNNQPILFENITEDLSIAQINKEKLEQEIKNNKIVNEKVILEKLNFTKMTNSSGKLSLDLSSSVSLANVKKADNYLIIEVPGMVASEELKKKINVQNFNLATKIIDILENENGIKIILEQEGYWTHSLSQADNKVNIEITSLTKEESEKLKEEEYRKTNGNSGKKLSLNFQNMEVRALLQVIADFTGINIVASDKVLGNMTLKLTEVPWEQALDIILDSKDLVKQQKGNVIWVATRDEYNTKQKNMIETQKQSYELEEIKLVSYQLNYHKASDVATFLIGGKTTSVTAASAGSSGAEAKTDSGDNRILSPRGSVNFDARTNTLFVQDIQSKIAEVSRIIKKLDASSRQVLIEAKIVIADDGWTRDLGVKYGFQYNTRRSGMAVGVGSNASNALNQVNGDTVTITETGGRSIVSPQSAIDLAASTGAATLGLSFLNQLTGAGLLAELSAMENENKGKVISNPRIVTFDHQAAKIEQGTEIPYVTPGTANTPATVSFRKAVLALNVIPQISPNGRVNLQLDIRKDTIGEYINVAGGGTVPSIDTRNVTTQVTVKNGQTIVLGGVYESITRNDIRKIPFLGDIPGIGNFFKNTIKENGKAELLIFITPHVIEDSLADQGVEAEVIDLQKIQ